MQPVDLTAVHVKGTVIEVKGLRLYYHQEGAGRALCSVTPTGHDGYETRGASAATTSHAEVLEGGERGARGGLAGAVTSVSSLATLSVQTNEVCGSRRADG